MICPCTGNTLAKAHLRNGRPLVIAISTNDGLAASARNIGTLLDKKNVYFVPFRQADPEKNPTSLERSSAWCRIPLRRPSGAKAPQPLLLGA